MYPIRTLIPILAALTVTAAQAATETLSNESPAGKTGFPTVALVSPAQAKTASDCSFSEMMGRNEGFESLGMSAHSTSTDEIGEQVSEKAVEADLPDWLME